MSTITIPSPETAVAAFSIADEKIAEWREEFMPLSIRDINDTKTLAVVHDARMTIKNTRVAVEKKRKELKADALEYGRIVDGEARRITALLLPIEEHLASQEDRVTAERERIRLEKVEAARAATQARVDALAAVGCVISFTDAEILTADSFQAKLSEATEAHRVEQERIAAVEAERLRLQAEEDARRKAEAEKLAAERAELDRIRAAQDAEAAKLAAERQRLADEEAARVRASEVEKAKADAAERARIETEQRLKREADEAKARAEAEAAERARVESLRPDRDKLLAFAAALEAVPAPVVSKESKAAATKATNAVATAVKSIREAANALAKTT